MPEHARLRPDLIVSPTQVDGQTLYTIKDPVTDNYFRLRKPEFWLASQLDGTRSVEEIAAAFSSRFDMKMSAESVAQFIATLEKLFFLEDGRSEQEMVRAARRLRRQGSLAARVLFLKLKAFNPGRLLTALTTVYRPFHRRFWFTLEIALMLIGAGVFLAHASEFSVQLGRLIQVGSIVTIIVALFLLISLHEFAHAVICTYYGGSVKEMGLLLMYFQPCFYSDVSDAWLFPNKAQRVAVTLAGLYFQFIFLSLSVILWAVTVPGFFINDFARICVIVSWVTFLFNFNPLIKLDGYYLLSDWLDIPNLRTKAFAYLGNVLKRRVLGWPIDKVEVSARERKIFPIYSVLALVYSIFLVLYFVFAAAVYLGEKFGGAGILLLLVVLAIILRDRFAAAARGVAKHFLYMKDLLHKPVRLTIYVVALLLLVFLFFFLPVPNRVSGEIVVQPISEFTISASGEGLVNLQLRLGGEHPEKRANVLKLASTEVGAFNLTPIVREGQTVAIGDTLAVVTSNQITKDIAANLAELKRLEGNLALLKAPKKKEEIQQAQADMTAAQANYDQLSREFKRTQGLAASSLVSQEKLESDRSAVEVAKAELNNKKSTLALVKSPPRPEEIAVLEQEINKQKTQIDYLKAQAEAQVVVTPISGVVVLGRSRGELLSILDNSVIELEVPVSDFDIKLVQVHQSAAVKVYPFPDTSFTGLVVRVPKFTVDQTAGNRFPVAVLVANSEGLLRQGMAGFAKISVGETSAADYLFSRLLSMIRVRIWSWW